jgi:hypothetical protein
LYDTGTNTRYIVTRLSLAKDWLQTVWDKSVCWATVVIVIQVRRLNLSGKAGLQGRRMNSYSVDQMVAVATFAVKENAGISVVSELVYLLLAAAK